MILYTYFVQVKEKSDYNAKFIQVCAFEEDLCHERDGLEKQKAALLEKNNKLEQNLEV